MVWEICKNNTMYRLQIKSRWLQPVHKTSELGGVTNLLVYVDVQGMMKGKKVILE